MKKLMFLTVLGLSLSCSHYGQLKLKGNLPKRLEEVSGVALGPNEGELWMHNDSGNDAVLYLIDSNGALLREVAVPFANRDWEDLCSDGDTLYVGDMGNNRNDRTNLVIYKVNAAQELIGSTYETIRFHYPDQKKFPPKKKKRFFDAEALIYKDRYLYLFTKSRVKGNYGNTKLYRIPATAGSHEAELLGTYEHCNKKLSCWITGAAISPDGTKVALLTHTEVLVFSDFSGDHFFEGTVHSYAFEHNSQKEGITFKDNTTLYITDEYAHGQGGNLYEFSLPLR